MTERVRQRAVDASLRTDRRPAVQSGSAVGKIGIHAGDLPVLFVRLRFGAQVKH